MLPFNQQCSIPSVNQCVEFVMVWAASLVVVIDCVTSPAWVHHAQ